MAKKYYWLKLKKDFFAQREIKKLRKIAGGDTFTIIYLKMLLLAMQSEEHAIGYDVPLDKIACELAIDIDEDEANVRVTLSFLEANHLLEYTETDIILSQVSDMVGYETEWAEKKRRYRLEHDKKEDNVPLISGQAEDNVLEKKDVVRQEIEKEIENKRKRKSKSKREEIEIECEMVQPAKLSNNLELFDKNISPLTPMIAEELVELEQEVGEAILAYAIRESARNNVYRFSYVKAVALNRKREGNKPTPKGADEIII